MDVILLLIAVVAVVCLLIIFRSTIKVFLKRAYSKAILFLKKSGTDIDRKQLSLSLDQANRKLLDIKNARSSAEDQLASAQRDFERWHNGAIGAAQKNLADLVAANLLHQKEASAKVEALIKHVEQLRQTEEQLVSVVQTLEHQINDLSSAETEAIAKANADQISSEAQKLLDSFGLAYQFDSGEVAPVDGQEVSDFIRQHQSSTL